MDQEIWIETLIREQLKVELSHSLWSMYDRIQTSIIFQAANYWMQRREKVSTWAQIKYTKACSVPFPDPRCSSTMAWEITVGLPEAPWYHSPVAIYPNLLWSLGEASHSPTSEGPPTFPVKLPPAFQVKELLHQPQDIAVYLVPRTTSHQSSTSNCSGAIDMEIHIHNKRCETCPVISAKWMSLLACCCYCCFSLILSSHWRESDEEKQVPKRKKPKTSWNKTKNSKRVANLIKGSQAFRMETSQKGCANSLQICELSM